MKPATAPRVTNPRRLAIVGVLALALILALLFFARSVIRELFVLPLSYLFWSIGVFVDTTPQIFFWIVALLLAGLAAYRSLVGRGKTYAETPPDLDGPPSARALHGQVSNWTMKVNLIRQGQSKYFQNSFHQTVGKLLMDTMAYRYHLSQNQIEDQLREGTLDVPEGVRNYALISLRRMDVVQPAVWIRYWTALVELFRSWFAPAAPREGGPYDGAVSTEEQQVLVVLKYIEGELEVPHDNTGH